MQNKDTKKTISSPVTFLVKFVIPILWIGFFVIFLPSISIKFSIDNIFFILLFIIGTVFLSRFNMRLKHVAIDDEKLYISNFFKTIEVFRRNISKIKVGPPLCNWQGIYVHFKEPTKFGNYIIFMPPLTFDFSFKESSPVIDELRKTLDTKRY